MTNHKINEQILIKTAKIQFINEITSDITKYLYLEHKQKSEQIERETKDRIKILISPLLFCDVFLKNIDNRNLFKVKIYEHVLNSFLDEIETNCF